LFIQYYKISSIYLFAQDDETRDPDNSSSDTKLYDQTNGPTPNKKAF